MRLMFVLGVLLCWATSPLASQSANERDAISTVIAPQILPSFQSEVLVLGTSHLDGVGGHLTDRHLDALIARLVAWRPTRIAIEALPSDEVALLGEHSAVHGAAGQVLGMFAGATYEIGREVQELLGLSRLEAAQRAEGRMAQGGALDDSVRTLLVAELVAAYDFNSAALQWSYLALASRASTLAISDSLRARLDRRLASRNEIVTVASRLARQLGVQRLYAIDSQWDGIRTLSASPQELRELFGDPGRGALIDTIAATRTRRIEADAVAATDLLPLYRHVNGEEHQRGDASQWNWLFAGRHSTGLDRIRYAMWEVRNARQATQILDVAASGRPERVLVLVGSSHKAALDRILRTQLSVRVVEAASVLSDQ